MTRYDRRVRVLAALLSGLAGYVDAIGFIHLGGVFVSFMSGNSTRLAVGLVQGSAQALVAAGVIGGFVLGVILGSLGGHFAGRHRRPVVLALVSGLLGAGAVFAGLGLQGPAIAAMVLAMGAENAVFARDGEVTIGLTYMTGTLVKLGQRLTGALLGGDRFGWAPYLLLWLGLLTGALAGAASYPVWGLGSLWIASAAGAALTLATLLPPFRERSGNSTG